MKETQSINVSYNLMGYDSKLLNRFWSKVSIPKDQINDCWEWTRGVNSEGYGKFGINSGKNISAHRFSYEYYNGKIPDGLLIRHTCDNTKCVNPNHLLLGDDQDNKNDSVSRNRVAYGEKIGASRLTEIDVQCILTLLWKGNVTCVELGKKYNIHPSNISLIADGKSWKRVYENLTVEQRQKIIYNVKNCPSERCSTLTPPDIIKIRELAKTITQTEIANIFNIGNTSVCNIIHRRTWKHVL